MAAMTGKKCLNDCGLLLDRKAIVCSARLFVKSLVLTRSAYWSSGIPLSVVVSRDWCVQILGRKPASLSKRVLSKRVLLAFILVLVRPIPRYRPEVVAVLITNENWIIVAVELLICVLETLVLACGCR
jgi:hypothetical protein